MKNGGNTTMERDINTVRTAILEQLEKNGQRKPNPIERINNPSKEVFDRLYLTKGKPVIIEGAVSNWKALSTWTPEYLKSKVGRKRVRVAFSPDGVYKKRNPQKMKLCRYIDLISSDLEEREKYYLAGLSVSKLLPELIRDFQVPEFVEKDKNAGMSLFLGRDSVTDCHFHPREENVLVQISGRKYIFLYSPEDFSNLYPKSSLSAHFNWSRIDFGQPLDLQRFPKFLKARLYEVVLEPGDMLFIPIHWWHVVYSPGFSIAGAFFWTANLKQWYFPNPGLRSYLQVNFIMRYPALKSLIPDFLRTQ